MEICVNTRCPSITCTSPARAASRGVALVMSRPPKRTCPALTGSNPDSARSMVVLPAPLGPSSATTSPGDTVKSIPCSTRILPYPDSSRPTASSGSGTEVSTDHLLVDANLGRRFGGQDAAEIEHGDPIADVQDKVRLVPPRPET